ncbi:MULTISPECIES: hypothetical protein [unclassified Psychrobacillus]|uniref:hypothetical protein n=1 Tax=unclassified Psychrobacillus TaxID=2636677 RepID=UPI0030F4FA66
MEQRTEEVLKNESALRTIWDLKEEELEVMAKKYNWSLEKAKVELKEGNLVLFPNEAAYIEWQLEDIDKDTLITMLREGEPLESLVDKRVIKLDKEEVVFHYE